MQFNTSLPFSAATAAEDVDCAVYVIAAMMGGAAIFLNS
jgi:hypothetical protein